ncbi:MAG: energy transducer TonB [Acidobacteria bacterium]|nr:energy transducer TonB [Acidobacteriota bacterium]
MSARLIGRWLSLAAFGLALVLAPSSPAWGQQEELSRKVKSRVNPVYPEIARRMSITGVVKVEVIVAPNGNVKTTKIVGGHPVLATAAVDAVKKWKFEPASAESTGIVEFKFATQE